MTKMESQKLVDEYLLYAEDEFINGQITENTLNRIRMSMAAEYLVCHDNEELSLITLNKVPVQYFAEVLTVDITNDSLFAASMAEFAYTLQLRGITFHGTIRTTQSLAEA